VGYAGIITLGHSAYFGLGAYIAGILAAKAGISDPMVQLAAAAAAGALLGISTGAIILRTKALTLLMLTLAITSVLLEIANKATTLTGGADGLSGVVGGLITQTNQFVGLNVLSFESAGELLVMLILGGVGRIYGAFVGPVAYLIAQDFLAKQFPEYWYFGIGTMLVLVVMFARGGILGILDGALVKLRSRP